MTRAEFESEWELESFLHANSEALLDETLLVFGRQVDTAAGEPDLLAVDRYGNVIVFELKQGKSSTKSASEETILTQPQTYASHLSSFSYEDLNEIYQTYRRDLQDKDWNVSDSVIPDPDLESAFETAFGIDLAHSEFNRGQRMVIVAERVTNQTRKDAHYLLEQGLDIQCVEVQRFADTGGGGSLVVTNTVVDYNRSRVRRGRLEHPAYPYVVEDIIERVFPEVSSIVCADSPETVFKDIRQPRPYLQSNMSEHPNGLRYTLYLRPEEWGNVVIGLDYWGSDESVLSRFKQREDMFNSAGFEVREDNKTERIVCKSWTTNSRDRLDNEAFREELAEALVTLVEMTHSVLGDL